MQWEPRHGALRGRVAVVAGATRGAGRGVAMALGEAGATVICTGRSSVARRGGSDYDRAETIEETAELVTGLGRHRHRDSGRSSRRRRVRHLAERVRDEHGRLDVLVNNIWGAELLKGGPADWNTPIWRHDLDAGLRILRLGVETHLITSHHLLPLLITKPGGLLAAHEATAIAVTPGWLRSEMMLENYGVTAANWRDALSPNRIDGYPNRPTGLRLLRIPALRRPGHRGRSRRPQPSALEPAFGHLRRTRPRVRIHRHRRLPAGQLGRTLTETGAAASAG